MPEQLNFVERMIPSDLISHGETSERFMTYGFTSPYFIVQGVLFYSLALVTVLIFLLVNFVVLKHCVPTERRTDFRERTNMHFRGILMRITMEFYVPVFI